MARDYEREEQSKALLMGTLGNSRAGWLHLHAPVLSIYHPTTMVIANWCMITLSNTPIESGPLATITVQACCCGDEDVPQTAFGLHGSCSSSKLCSKRVQSESATAGHDHTTNDGRSGRHSVIVCPRCDCGAHVEGDNRGSCSAARIP
eukprot:3908262-Amphidinium_carterae.1